MRGIDDLLSIKIEQVSFRSFLFSLSEKKLTSFSRSCDMDLSEGEEGEVTLFAS